ncbi:hypothetical protein TNCV_4158471, partial [Trichonephila clavipes]
MYWVLAPSDHNCLEVMDMNLAVAVSSALEAVLNERPRCVA